MENADSVSFNTVREAYNNPLVKDKVLTTFKEQIKCLENNTFSGSKSAIKDIPDTIYNYPKVIFEIAPDETIRGQIASAFRELKEVRLPYPKLTIITAGTWDKNNKPTQLIPIYFVQAEDSVVGYVITNTLGRTDVFAYRYYLSEFGDVGSNKILTEVLLSPEHLKLAGKEKVEGLAGWMMYVITRTVYMMTISGGEFYVSTPTPKEANVNIKRIRKNKKPTIEFRTVVIDGRKSEPSTSILHTTHASPNQHWRRGHYRNTKTGRKVWISPMLVGDEKNGKIIKDYVITKQGKSYGEC